MEMTDLMLFCLLWLMHILLIAFICSNFFLACNVAILLLISYKFSVDNMFLLGFLVLVFIKMIVKINDELY